MPRLFTGLEVPSHASENLSLLRGGLNKARWVDPDNYHITLKFIGDIDQSIADEVIAELGKVESDSLDIRISGFGVFGGKKPHSVHANVELTPKLSRLREEQERILNRIGVESEKRKFIPHVTLARFRGVSPEEVAGWIQSKGHFSIPSYEIERFVLYSAKESVGGGPYVVEVGYPFRQKTISATGQL